MIKVVIKRASKAPEVKNIKNDLATFQRLVGGNITAFYPNIRGVAAYINDEGRLLDLKPNLILTDRRNRWIDTIVGTAVFFAVDGENEVSLSDKQIDQVLNYINERDLILI